MKVRDLKQMMNHTTGVLNGRLQAVNGVDNAETRSLLTRDGVNQSFLDYGERGLANDCGYPNRNPTIEALYEMYEQEGVAARVVNLFPDECWAWYPEVYEREDDRVTLWERSLKNMNAKVPYNHYLHRVDRMSRIGHFGGVFYGFKDGSDFSKPVRRKEGLELLYMRPFSEMNMQIMECESKNNERFGQPLFYNLNFAVPAPMSSGVPAAMSVSETWKKVHWTRVLHVADNREESDVIGTPAQQVHFRRLLDLRKTYAGSAEMYWQGAFPGFAFDPLPDLSDEDELDIEAIQDALEQYMAHLQRYLAAVGGSFRSLAPQVVDPTPQIMAYINIICAVMGCPVQVFMGSEAGKAQGDQYKQVWNGRVMERQRLYVEPMILRPHVDRMMMVGCLPKIKEYHVAWRDLNTLSDKDKADVCLKRIQSILQYCQSGAEKILPLNFFYTMFLAMNQTEADAVMAMVKAGNVDGLVTKELWTATQQAAKAAEKLKMQGGKAGSKGTNTTRNPVGGTKLKPNRR